MAEHRHKRETNAFRMPRASLVAGPLAVLATASAITLGVLASDPAARELLAADASSDVASAAPPRQQVISRGGSRDTIEPMTREEAATSPAATRLAVRAADTKLWTSETLNLWDEPGEDADQVGEIDAGEKVLVTGRTVDGRVEIVVDGDAVWVTEGYLTDEKPLAAAAGLSMEPCPDPGVESGLTDDAVYVYRSVCHAFPQITSYGGWDAHGEHSSGRAIDIMTSDVALGTAIAEFLQEHAAELNLYDILWRQRIWTPVRAGEGWRAMPSRGSATANHYDHVHVATNG